MAKSGGSGGRGFSIARSFGGRGFTQSEYVSNYKYNIRGGRSSMYATSLKSARRMIKLELGRR